MRRPIQIANYITLQVTLEFDRTVDPDAVRKAVDTMLEDHIEETEFADVQEISTRLLE